MLKSVIRLNNEYYFRPHYLDIALDLINMRYLIEYLTYGLYYLVEPKSIKWGGYALNCPRSIIYDNNELIISKLSEYGYIISTSKVNYILLNSKYIDVVKPEHINKIVDYTHYQLFTDLDLAKDWVKSVIIRNVERICYVEPALKRLANWKPKSDYNLVVYLLDKSPSNDLDGYGFKCHLNGMIILLTTQENII